MDEAPALAVETADRTLNVWLEGDDRGLPFVFHLGSPGPPVGWPDLAGLSRELGLRVIKYARPGYSGSTRHEGRTVVDAASDTGAVLDALGADEFLVVGWSGGGPHALACAARHPTRCLGAASIAGVVPFDTPGKEFTAGMAEENVVEFALVLEGEAALRPYLEEFLEQVVDATGADVVESLGGLASEIDRAALTDEFASLMARLLRRTAQDGIDGWVDDDLAFAKPWGFSVDEVQVPVAVWQGREDRMVPYSHGEWLAAHIPNARAHLFEDEGHISLVANRLGDILSDLVEIAGI